MSRRYAARRRYRRYARSAAMRPPAFLPFHEIRDADDRERVQWRTGGAAGWPVRCCGAMRAVVAVPPPLTTKRACRYARVWFIAPCVCSGAYALYARQRARTGRALLRQRSVANQVAEGRCAKAFTGTAASRRRALAYAPATCARTGHRRCHAQRVRQRTAVLPLLIRYHAVVGGKRRARRPCAQEGQAIATMRENIREFAEKSPMS